MTYYMLFVIDLKTRFAEIAGITATPNEAFMAQVARNWTDCVDECLLNHRFLILDRDTKFKKQFKATPITAGGECALTPVMAPNCNAFAERFVLLIKSECLNRRIFFGERRLRYAVRENVEHYHLDRAHQGLGSEHIVSSTQVGNGAVLCNERPCGLLKHYRRAA